MQVSPECVSHPLDRREYELETSTGSLYMVDLISHPGSSFYGRKCV